MFNTKIILVLTLSLFICLRILLLQFTVGLINTHFCLIDMKEIASRPRVRVSPESRMWHRVLASTGQPDLRAERQHTYRDPANSFE